MKENLQEQSNYERVELRVSPSRKVRIGQDDRDYNISAMADGVKSIHCVFVGSFKNMSCDAAEKMLKAGEFINSAEVYANGAINLFIRNNAGRLIALIRVRPLGVQVLDG